MLFDLFSPPAHFPPHLNKHAVVCVIWGSRMNIVLYSHVSSSASHYSRPPPPLDSVILNRALPLSLSKLSHFWLNSLLELSQSWSCTVSLFAHTLSHSLSLSSAVTCPSFGLLLFFFFGVVCLHISHFFSFCIPLSHSSRPHSLPFPSLPFILHPSRPFD